jgi:hypothetical protein
LRNEVHGSTDPEKYGSGEESQPPPADRSVHRAFDCLRRNLHMLRTCGNPACETPLFIANKGKQTYCCVDLCGRWGQQKATTRWWKEEGPGWRKKKRLERFGRTYSELRHQQFLGSNSLAVGLAAPNQRRDAHQGREGGIGVFQLKTWADGDNFTCLNGRRWDEYLRRSMRTYSSTSREVLSSLRITHVLKHNDVSEGGFTTTPSARIGMPRGRPLRFVP